MDAALGIRTALRRDEDDGFALIGDHLEARFSGAELAAAAPRVRGAIMKNDVSIWSYFAGLGEKAWEEGTPSVSYVALDDDGTAQYLAGAHGGFHPKSFDAERLASSWTEVRGVSNSQ